MNEWVTISKLYKNCFKNHIQITIWSQNSAVFMHTEHSLFQDYNLGIRLMLVGTSWLRCLSYKFWTMGKVLHGNTGNKLTYMGCMMTRWATKWHLVYVWWHEQQNDTHTQTYYVQEVQKRMWIQQFDFHAWHKTMTNFTYFRNTILVCYI